MGKPYAAVLAGRPALLPALHLRLVPVPDDPGGGQGAGHLAVQLDRLAGHPVGELGTAAGPRHVQAGGGGGKVDLRRKYLSNTRAVFPKGRR